jgi:hypothetical protein
MKHFLLFCTLVFAFALSANAQDKNTSLSPEDIQRLQKFSSEFAICSGVYEMVSEIHGATDAPNLSRSVQETANGAFMAAHWLVFSTGLIQDGQKAKEYVENLKNSSKLSWAAEFEKSDINNAMSKLTEKMKYCNKFQNAQEELVQQARLWLYSQNPTKSE